MSTGVSFIAGPEVLSVDERQESVVAAVSETPGMSERMARSAYAEVAQELSESNQEVTDAEMAELVVHKVSLFQVKALMNALDAADGVGQGEVLVGKIKEVGGKVIMQAMSGEQVAKDRIAQEFVQDVSLELFGRVVMQAEETYVSDSEMRIAAFHESNKSEHLGAILANIDWLLGNLKRKSKEVVGMFGMSVDDLIDLVEAIAAKARASGVASLSGGERSILSQAAKV